MTTENIKSVQILLETDDNKVLIGTSSDPILMRLIASYVKFVEMDKARFVSTPIKDIIKKAGAK